MQKQTRKFLIFIILISVLIIPSFVSASWYNPFSWNIWSNTWNSVSNIVTNIVSTIAENVFQKKPPASSRFVDNGDRSITDTQSGNTWLKCDYGFEGQNCDGKFRKTVSVGMVTCGGSGISPKAAGNESATAYCNNGVLCKDGTFVTVNWLDDKAKHKNEYLEYQLLQTNCYVQVKDTAKERACQQHGGISKKDWRVPTLDELKTLDTKNQFGLDKKYFPNSSNKFLTSTSFFDQTGMVENIAYSYNFQGHSSDKVQSASLKCVTYERNAVPVQQTQTSGDIFCQTKFPSYKYFEYETIFSDSSSPSSGIMKQWEKDDIDSYSVYLKTGSTGAGDERSSWSSLNKKTGYDITLSCDGNNNVGWSNCSKTTDSLKMPEELDLETVYNKELGTEQRIIGGQKCTMLKTPRPYDYSLGSGKSQNIGYVDCINKTACEFLIDSSDVQNNMVTKILKIDYVPFSDSIFTPPTKYTDQTDSSSKTNNTNQGTSQPTNGAVSTPNVKDSDVQAILIKFCPAVVNIDYKKTDYSAEYTKKLDGLKVDELINNLNKDIYVGNQLPEALQYLGLKLMQGSRVDDSLKIYKCAAEKYYDMVSMYKMARVYKDGTGSIKKQLPNAIIKNEIKLDFKQAYFWAAATLLAESAEKTGMLSAGTSLGWNTIAILDDLQNTGKLTNKEMTDIENTARIFIGKRYPEILK